MTDKKASNSADAVELPQVAEASETDSAAPYFSDIEIPWPAGSAAPKPGDLVLDLDSNEYRVVEDLGAGESGFWRVRVRTLKSTL